MCDQLDSLVKQFKAPLLCAGDLFNRPQEPPEFINFMLRVLPFMYCIRGNHDTSCGRADETHRSVYGTMVQTGTIKNIDPRQPLAIGRLMVHGFPHGTPAVPLKNKRDDHFHLALVHAYLWKRGYAYEKVTDDSSIHACWPSFRGYDAVAVGDNHKGFLARSRHYPSVLNCGTLMRRTTAEKDYQPKVGIINSDGTIVRMALDCSADRFISLDDTGVEVDDGFVQKLQNEVDNECDYDSMLRQELKRVDPVEEVRNLVLKSVE